MKKKILICGISMMLGFLTMEALAASANLKWAAPTQRENGKALAASEIASYEIQYKAAGESTYKAVEVKGNVTSAVIPDLVIATPSGTAIIYEFRIAVTATDGLSSGFISLTPVLHNPPKGVTGGTFMVIP